MAENEEKLVKIGKKLAKIEGFWAICLLFLKECIRSTGHIGPTTGHIGSCTDDIVAGYPHTVAHRPPYVRMRTQLRAEGPCTDRRIERSSTRGYVSMLSELIFD